MSDPFYYDYFALRGVDIPAWHAAFSWPVPRETTTRIMVDFVAAYTAIVEELGDTAAGDAALSGILVPGLFVQAVNHYLAVETLRRQGRPIVHSDRLTLVPQFLRPREPMRFAPARLPGRPRNGTARLRAKRAVQSLWYNRGKLSRALDHLDLARCAVAFDSGNVLDRPFTRSRPEWVRLFSPAEWHGAEAAVPSGVREALDGAARDFTRFAAAYSRDVLGVPLPPTLLVALEDYAARTLAIQARCYHGLLELLGRRPPRELLTSTAGNSFTRVASLAARRLGARVTGFPHGSYICHYQSPRQAFHELATVDAFVAYTPASARLMERNLALNPPPRANPVRILHEHNTALSDRFAACRRNPLPGRIRSIMVCELSLIPEWAGYHCADVMVNYHFYYSVCRQLAQAGYEVVFKKRPKSLGWDGYNIFESIPGVRVETRPFEAPGVLDQVDAVMIQYAMSSTLYWSMCSSKTVLYVDSGWEPWFPDVYERMARRCRVLRCAYDEANRPVYDPSELAAHMERSPEPPDADFIEAYLTPR